MVRKAFPLSLVLILTLPLTSYPQDKIQSNTIRVAVVKTVSYPDFDNDEKGFEQVLKEWGVKERISIIFDRHDAKANEAIARNIAFKFLNSKPDIIHSIATLASKAVVKNIKHLPVVFSSVTDPIDAELVPKTKDNKSGTNVTGVSDRWPVELQLEMYTKFFQKAKRWGTIYNANDTKTVSYIKEMRQTAKRLGIDLIEAKITNESEIISATYSLAEKIQAIYITFDRTVISSFDRIVKVCNEKKIPLLGGDSRCVLMGAIAAYGWDYFQIGHLAARKAIQILKGQKPGKIPWESGEKLILLVNERAAKNQGTIIPPEILKKADQIIF